MNIWLMKPEGLYDTFETADIDLSEWFEEEEYEMFTHGRWSMRRRG